MTIVSNREYNFCQLHYIDIKITRICHALVTLTSSTRKTPLLTGNKGSCTLNTRLNERLFLRPLRVPSERPHMRIIPIRTAAPFSDIGSVRLEEISGNADEHSCSIALFCLGIYRQQLLHKNRIISGNDKCQCRKRFCESANETTSPPSK